MIGYFVVESFGGSKDSAGFDTQINVSNRMDMNIKNTLYLPPYMRKSQSNIGIGDIVFGIVDDITGIGCALFGENSADYKYFFDADIEIKKNLTVDIDITSQLGTIKALAGDVIATTTSLQTHTHPILTITGSDAKVIITSASTESPGEFTQFFTSIPL